uniref:Uncharacterized protein n=1 Tax=Varanus komodoensis TaxID=61221 RepID=A0A8D2L277_VARKO
MERRTRRTLGLTQYGAFGLRCLRRPVRGPECACPTCLTTAPSPAGSTSSSLGEHWVSRLPGSRQPSIASAASSRRTSLASLSESVELMGERSEDDGGFSTRPFVRSVQRQSLSSRSPVTSPLAVGENGMRPSWSLSAKLQIRSGSPSRFSGDTPPFGSAVALERVGGPTTGKGSASCFGGLNGPPGSTLEPGVSRHRHQEPLATGRAPLATMEGAFRDEMLEQKSSSCADSCAQTSGPAGRKGPALDPFDNNNLIAFVDQSDSVESSPVKEGGSFGGAVVPPAKGGSSPQKALPPEDTTQTDRSQRKGRALLSSQDSPTSHPSASSPPPPKSLPKGSRTQNKQDSGRPGRRHGSPASGQPRKGAGLKALDAAGALPAQQKQRPVSAAASSTAARRDSLGSTARGQVPAAGKMRTADRGLSREGSKLSLGSDKAGPGSGSGSRTSSPRLSQSRGEGRAPEGSHVRSSSMASLRSPPTGPRSSLKRDSKSDDKGLSFFKSALRQKETRRSADLGKTTLLSKKMGGSSCKAAGKSTSPEKGGRSGTQLPPGTGPAAKEAASPAKHSLLAHRKSQSSQPEASPQAAGSGRPGAGKAPRQLPPGTPSSARAASKSQ